MFGVPLLARRSVYLGCILGAAETMHRHFQRASGRSRDLEPGAGRAHPATSRHLRASDNLEAFHRERARVLAFSHWSRSSLTNG